MESIENSSTPDKLNSVSLFIYSMNTYAMFKNLKYSWQDRMLGERDVAILLL